MSHSVTLIPGDGVGPEVTEAVRRVLEATGVRFHWDVVMAGAEAIDKSGTPLPDEVLASIRANKVALKGPVTTPVGHGFRSINVALRQNLDLYACLRPCKSYVGAPTLYKDVDIVVVRENTEGLYAGIEFEKGRPETGDLIKLISDAVGRQVSADTGFSVKAISEAGSRNIVRFAFEYAHIHSRRKVTAVHKANIMKFSDGLFLSVAREVARDYTDIEFDDVIVDALAMRLVRSPQAYDVLVLPNLYGDIVSDLCAGLIGGLGLAPGANIGDGAAVFEATHGSAPQYAGQNKVNPMAMMLSGVMMLRHLDEGAAAGRLERAIVEVLAEGKNLTYDLKTDSPVGTSQVADAVIEKLR